MGSLIKLASFICSAKYAQMELHSDFGDAEWQSEVRSKVVRAV